jgi:hypothetical protein
VFKLKTIRWVGHITCKTREGDKWMKGRDNVGELDVDKKIILKWEETECEGVNWIHLAQVWNSGGLL